MGDYFNGKLIDVGIADQFGVELEFDINIPEPQVDKKFCFIPKSKQKLYDAKITMLNVQQKP